jgi:hypothetical protein
MKGLDRCWSLDGTLGIARRLYWKKLMLSALKVKRSQPIILPYFCAIFSPTVKPYKIQI